MNSRTLCRSWPAVLTTRLPAYPRHASSAQQGSSVSSASGSSMSSASGFRTRTMQALLEAGHVTGPFARNVSHVSLHARYRYLYEAPITFNTTATGTAPVRTSTLQSCHGRAPWQCRHLHPSEIVQRLCNAAALLCNCDRVCLCDEERKCSQRCQHGDDTLYAKRLTWNF